jgi:hypothetical protein
MSIQALPFRYPPQQLTPFTAVLKNEHFQLSN